MTSPQALEPSGPQALPTHHVVLVTYGEPPTPTFLRSAGLLVAHPARPDPQGGRDPAAAAAGDRAGARAGTAAVVAAARLRLAARADHRAAGQGRGPAAGPIGAGHRLADACRLRISAAAALRTGPGAAGGRARVGGAALRGGLGVHARACRARRARGDAVRYVCWTRYRARCSRISRLITCCR